MTVGITAIVDAARARIELQVQFANTAITACLIERKDPYKPWMTIRSGENVVCEGGACGGYDYEAPFDQQVTYRATQVIPAGTEMLSQVAGPLPSLGHTWLKDPYYPSRNQRLDEVVGLPELTYASRSGVFPVIDRKMPVAISSLRQGWAGTFEWVTATEEQRVRMNELFAQGQVLLLATPYTSIGSSYVIAGDLTEQRLGVVTEPTRRWSVPFTAVDRPESLGFAPELITWSGVRLKYIAWTDAIADNANWKVLRESYP